MATADKKDTTTATTVVSKPAAQTAPGVVSNGPDFVVRGFEYLKAHKGLVFGILIVIAALLVFVK